MRVYNDMDLVAQLGSGIPRILQFYGKECFKFSDNYTRIAFPAEQEKTVGKTTQDKIEELLEDNPLITREILAKRLQLSVRGVAYQLKKLKDMDIIERQGGQKEGYWNIKNQNND